MEDLKKMGLGDNQKCLRCKEQIEKNHTRVIEINPTQAKNTELFKVIGFYHGDCAVEHYSEMNPQRDNEIRAKTAKEIVERLIDMKLSISSDSEDTIDNAVNLIRKEYINTPKEP